MAVAHDLDHGSGGASSDQRQVLGGDLFGVGAGADFDGAADGNIIEPILNFIVVDSGASAEADGKGTNGGKSLSAECN
jgi:hypothetical protein